MDRRRFALAGALGLAPWAGAAADAIEDRFGSRSAVFMAGARRIELASGGRLGAAMLDTRSERPYHYRGDERFPMCSTFKLLAAGLVLARVDEGKEQLARRIAIQPSDLVEYAPRTQPRVGGEPMTVAELCEAAVTLSDNAAANVLLRSFGGPAALTAFARRLGDKVTRLDRSEPELNTAVAGDPRDTTSPLAMLRTVHKLVLGDALSPSSREQLTTWLAGNKVGDARFRAGLMAGWRVADKTGTGPNGTSNDIGVAWPPGRQPIVLTAYLTGSKLDAGGRDRALADVARLVNRITND
ncbi:MAG: class beta-lactamase [Ramlibacter sp.]|nr:class beta-lactamase [Ramlibacter sp.]